jgi:hypothetical protein
VRFTVECVFNVIFSVENSKITSKLHIQNASIIDPLGSKI